MPGSNQTVRMAKARRFAGSACEHGPVAREAELDLARRLAFDLDGLANDPHVLPAGAVAVLVRVVRVGLVDVEVLLIDGEDGEAEGDLAVVADGDAGQRRLAGADDGEAGRVQVDDVAQRRHADGRGADRSPGSGGRSPCGRARWSSCSSRSSRGGRPPRPGWSRVDGRALLAAAARRPTCSVARS